MDYGHNTQHHTRSDVESQRQHNARGYRDTAHNDTRKERHTQCKHMMLRLLHPAARLGEQIGKPSTPTPYMIYHQCGKQQSADAVNNRQHRRNINVAGSTGTLTP